MDERTMFELLEMYDAVCELEIVPEMLLGSSVGAGYGEGILGNLTYVTDIIMRFSPLYVPGEEEDESDFWKTLNSDMGNHDKARILLGSHNQDIRDNPASGRTAFHAILPPLILKTISK